MTKKPTKTKPLRPAAFLETKVKKLQRENSVLRKRMAELEQRPTFGEVYSGKDAPEVVTVQVGPLMPWETALPNSFEGKS